MQWDDQLCNTYILLDDMVALNKPSGLPVHGKKHNITL